MIFKGEICSISSLNGLNSKYHNGFWNINTGQNSKKNVPYEHRMLIKTT